MPDPPTTYDAFISYALEQRDVAIWLHRLLERFWVPGRRARTVFLDREHLTADELGRSVVRSGTLPARRLRLDVPPGSYSLSLTGEYADPAPRTLTWPLLLDGEQAKTQWLRLPTKESFDAAADMAWISAGVEHVDLGQDGERIAAPAPFWIDVYPVRARQVWGTQADAQLCDTKSVEQALIEVPAGSLPQLIGDMKDIMAFFDAETENFRRVDPEQFPPVMLRPSKAACDDCPAPVAKDDAVSWCASRGGRLPTLTEWRLGAAGIDARLYPWGNRFDRRYANVVGLPNKGDFMALTPVTQFPHGASPFGVWDSVGNSGEWIDDGDLADNVQAGGGYWNDRDGATVFALDPVTLSYPYEIGMRCVLEDSRR